MTAVDLVARVRGGVVGDGQDLVIFCGSGATAAVAKLVGLLELGARAGPAGARPVVFVGPHEHHSNLLPWRESAAEVVAVGGVRHLKQKSSQHQTMRAITILKLRKNSLRPKRWSRWKFK